MDSFGYPHQKSPELEAIKVLLVDDEVELTDAISRRLESRGFATATAQSGNEAFEKLGDEEFDEVLLDLVMPGRDGLETLREIRSRKPLTEVRRLQLRGPDKLGRGGIICDR